MSVLFNDVVHQTKVSLAPGLAATYPINDTSLSLAEREYLVTLQNFAEEQDLDEDLRTYVRGITIAFTIFAAIIVALRFVARRLQAAKILIDDYLMLASLVLLIGNMIMNLILIDHGLGLHSGVLPLENLQFLDRTMIGAEILYCSAVSLYKIALLYLYFRIFPLPEVRKWGRICGFVVAGWTVAVWIAACVQCIPLAKLWEPWREGWCINLFLTQLAIAVPCIICDIAILCLPIPHVLKLQMNKTQKSLVLVAFLLGSYVVFTSVYRFRVFLLFTTNDSSYTLGDPVAWNIIEISSGIISACLPTLPPVLRYVFANIMNSTAMSSIKKSNIMASGNKLTGLGGGPNGGGTSGGGGTGNHSRHTRSASQDWAKLNGASSTNREESKYGIGLTTIMREDDSRSSDDIELMKHQGPGSPHTPHTMPMGFPTAHHHHGDQGQKVMMGVHTTVKSDKKAYRKTMSHSWGAEHEAVSAPTSIWQNRMVEVTIEPAEVVTDSRTGRTRYN